MALPLIGVGVVAAASYIARMGAVKAAKRFTPALIKKAKEFLKKKKPAKEQIEKGVKNVKSKKKTEKDFSTTPLSQSSPTYNFDKVNPRKYNYKHIDKYIRD
jgi:hypothetical protein